MCGLTFAIYSLLELLTVGVNSIPTPMQITRLLGNRLLVRFLDQPKPQINGIHVPIHVIPKNPRAVVILIGEGRSGMGKRGVKSFRFRTNHARELMSEVQVGDIVQINTKMGNVKVSYKGQDCSIVSTLDVQARFEIA